MPTTINADGSVTYSITLPGALAVTTQAPTVGGGQATYAAGSAVVAADPAQLAGQGWAEHIAGMIAIRDQMQLDYAAAQRAKVDALASTLYAADVADLPDPTPFPQLDDPDANGYRKRAAVLDSLGVELKGGAKND